MHSVVASASFSAAAVSEETALALYRAMVRARRFDERALSLQRQGWMSGYPQFSGQEASQVGAAHALAAEDWLFPTYRANAMQLVRGVPMSDILLFRRGHATLSDSDVQDLPQAVPIATQIPHAVGAAMAADYRDADHAVCAYFGDGATSEGDFHEGLNFAGVFDAPVVFFCENNGWAISLPVQQQTASTTLAQKAEAYGFDGVRVDGNDPVAVWQVVTDALEQAREGDPVMIESLTYRRGAHTTSDDPSRYEHRQTDLPDWRTRDPLDRYEGWLREAGLLDDEQVEQVQAEVATELEAAVESAEEQQRPDPEAMFERVYAELTPPLDGQRAQLQAFLEEYGHPDPVNEP
ncbi:MAG: pyruvate/2-oxoglutarate dehydrogenase complex, dehydrogenase (E1) component, alpha subunit [halophilic archaeon J07HX64]|jgi:Pyruvate/2-oxoglutarate dehydrogenase complex, dehydrogenase (E1) component, eukaryotic type, alpha subunit|nr:MAG: pyruvate/2-oxoglutarate dehydrogenase complex, dehydrogenase (E1) component, alpha subunit [halophilic archaeon J07HX64]